MQVAIPEQDGAPVDEKGYAMVQVTRVRLALTAVCGGLLTAAAVGPGAAGAQAPPDPPGDNG